MNECVTFTYPTQDVNSKSLLIGVDRDLKSSKYYGNIVGLLNKYFSHSHYHLKQYYQFHILMIFGTIIVPLYLYYFSWNIFLITHMPYHNLPIVTFYLTISL